MRSPCPACIQQGREFGPHAAAFADHRQLRALFGGEYCHGVDVDFGGRAGLTQRAAVLLDGFDFERGEDDGGEWLGSIATAVEMQRHCAHRLADQGGRAAPPGQWAENPCSGRCAGDASSSEVR
ncbi:hypothetical protein VW23_028060 [Devosia insulae DS-56]|uniref:Uncharacterized protein n=1 Tax=Devosia insulae DS-56 TaxID=1116389 RepID=A0A1E5XJW4_9HYPH|nr:hypothetical protein [Devosia insulae]OEO28888.1 hypothetical protein VW23_028060 [Devosia insulae DS-56]